MGTKKGAVTLPQILKLSRNNVLSSKIISGPKIINTWTYYCKYPFHTRKPVIFCTFGSNFSPQAKILQSSTVSYHGLSALAVENMQLYSSQRWAKSLTSVIFKIKITQKQWFSKSDHLSAVILIKITQITWKSKVIFKIISKSLQNHFQKYIITYTEGVLWIPDILNIFCAY